MARKGDDMSDDGIYLRPVGRVRSPRVTKDDDFWDDVEAVIEFDGAYFEPAALWGLDQFSHAEIIFQMDKVNPAAIETRARHPRDRADWPLVGIFAQRAKARPNRLGVSCCEILAVEGLRLFVRALDAIDGTPVLDVKPYLEEFGPRGMVRQPEWSRAVMKDYYRSSIERKLPDKSNSI